MLTAMWAYMHPVAKWTMIVAIFILVYLLLGVLANLSGMLKSISVYFDRRKDVEKLTLLSTEIENSAIILTFIDKMIEMTMAVDKEWHIVKGVPYNFLKMDDAIKNLSQKIHDALPIQVFDANKRLAFVHPQFIDQYIVDSVTKTIVDTYRTTNTIIAQNKPIDPTKPMG